MKVTTRSTTKRSTVATRFNPSVLLLVIIFSMMMSLTYKITAAQAQSNINSWWPVNNSQVSANTPFKGLLNGYSVDNYDMYWTVDNGVYNKMHSNFQDYPHKEVVVDVSSWTWRGKGPYKVSYIAVSGSGSELGRLSFDIYNYSIPSINLPTSILPSLITVKPLSNLTLFVDPDSNVSQQANIWRSSRTTDAAQIDKIAKNATAKWFGGWNYNVESDVKKHVDRASLANSTATIVAYNIPHRDCGGYSAGGTSATDYSVWIQSMARAIGDRKAIVILEPDAIAGLDCLSFDEQNLRTKLLADAVTALKKNASTHVYLDAGHARWNTPETMAQRLKQANISNADGFSLNVSNYIASSETNVYGASISKLVNNKHFVVDTSRSGFGSNGEWCNAPGRALGEIPSTNVSNNLVDAYLWIKVPGESDGNCYGGPSAGTWWPEYALGLAQRTAY